MQPKLLGREIVAETPFVRLERIHWQDAKGQTRQWDRGVRTPGKRKEEMLVDEVHATRGKLLTNAPFSPEQLPAEAESLDSADAVICCTIVHRAGGAARDGTDKECEKGYVSCSNLGSQLRQPDAKFVFVKQYRPPLGRMSLEFPAGLIDGGETAEQAGIRELTEETGLKRPTCVSLSPPLPLSPGIVSETAVIAYFTVDLNHPDNANPKQQLEDGEDIEVITVPVKEALSFLRESANAGIAVFAPVWATVQALSVVL